MSAATRLSALFFVVALGLTSAACAGQSSDAQEQVGSGEEAISSGDIAQSDSLLAEAVQQADAHAKDACGSEVYRSTIVDTINQAIALRDTVWFRTQVIAKKPELVRELGGTLEWQKILGVYDPAKPSTLVAAANAGFSLWDTSGGVYGNKVQLELANGKAIVHTLDTDSADLHWTTANTTWTYANGTLTLGTGETYALSWENGMLVAKTADGSIAFVSQQSECEA